MDNVKMDLKETGWEDFDWIYLAQDWDQWRASVKVKKKNVKLSQ
jgi:hypothetical protein